MPAPELVAPVVRPRNSPGIDWGAERVVLARVRGTARELVWRRPHTRYLDRMSGSRHVGGSLRLYDDAQVPVARTLCDGGRLSRKLLAAHAAEIDAFFGAPVAVTLDPTRTLLIDPPG